MTILYILVEWLSLGDNIRHGFDTGLYPQKRIVLAKENGYGIICQSLASASRMLNQSNGYVSGQIIKNKPIKDKQGNVYKIY